MLSGKRALANLDATLASARADLDRVDETLERHARQLAENRRLEAQSLKALARLRLDAIASGQLIEALDAADLRAREALEARDQALAELEHETAQLRGRVDTLERSRLPIHEEVETAGRALAEAEAAVQERLDGDPGYATQLDACRAADDIAAAAKMKTQTAENDRLEKGQPFENDPLFSYLWSRHYGTSDYRANPLARMLDAWVARLCGYNDARPNYWMLLEIPKRLQAHADNCRSEAERQTEALQALEEEAAAAGDVPERRAELETAETKQDQLDADIAAVENELSANREERAAFAAGEDEHLARGLQALTEALQRRDVIELRHAARRTTTSQDDSIVAEIADIREERDDLGQAVRQHRELHATAVDRLKELENVRRSFKRHRYDDVRSSFGNEELIATVLSQFLRGTLQSGVLWETLRRQQRYRNVGGAWPDFGSGGMINRRRRSPWHRPGGGVGWRIPRSGGFRSRGGFRTGGGF